MPLRAPGECALGREAQTVLFRLPQGLGCFGFSESSAEEDEAKKPPANVSGVAGPQVPAATSPKAGGGMLVEGA